MDGRKSKKAQYYLTKDGLTVLRGWVRSGATMSEIAEKMEISRMTLSKWLDRYPEMSEVFFKTKEIVDYEVEAALYKSAIGHTVTTKETGEDGLVHEVTKYIPPNITAQIFWLKNRMPRLWRDKNITEMQGGLPIVIKDDLKE